MYIKRKRKPFHVSRYVPVPFLPRYMQGGIKYNSKQINIIKTGQTMWPSVYCYTKVTYYLCCVYDIFSMKCINVPLAHTQRKEAAYKTAYISNIQDTLLTGALQGSNLYKRILCNITYEKRVGKIHNSSIPVCFFCNNDTGG